MFREHCVAVNTRMLNVAEGPKHGPSVWFFHGVGRQWRDFSPLFANLAPQFHLWASDHRGHGQSDRAAEYFVPDYIADAAELLTNTGEPTILVGHSLGALVALGVAATVPERVRAVVLLDPPGPTFLANVPNTSYSVMWQAMQRFASSPRPLGEVTRELAEVRLPGSRGGETIRLGDVRDATALRWMARCLCDLDPATLTPPLECNWLGSFDPIAAAKLVRCPALLVAADPACGGMLPKPDADALAAALPDGSRVDLPGIGHLVHWQDTAATLRLLHAFLGSL